MLAINIITILILCLIVYQDIKYRAIQWLLFLLLFAMFVCHGLAKLSSLLYLKGCLSNLLFLTVQMSLLVGFYILKGESLKSIFNSYIGLGDMILLSTLAFSFSKINFIVFYISGLIFSLLIWLVISNYWIKRSNKVPLAGFLSLYLIFIVLGDLITTQFETFSDNFLIHLIYG